MLNGGRSIRTELCTTSAIDPFPGGCDFEFTPACTESEYCTVIMLASRWYDLRSLLPKMTMSPISIRGQVLHAVQLAVRRPVRRLLRPVRGHLTAESSNIVSDAASVAVPRITSVYTCYNVPNSINRAWRDKQGAIVISCA